MSMLAGVSKVNFVSVRNNVRCRSRNHATPKKNSVWRQYAKLGGVQVNQIGPNVMASSSIEGVGKPKRELRQEALNDGHVAILPNEVA